MIKVLIVDDSTTESAFLERVLGGDPEITVVGRVTNGADALKAILRTRPDVVTMDTVMPGMDGFETTRHIMESNPLPVIIVTSAGEKVEAKIRLRAAGAGAVATQRKPVGIHHTEHKSQALQLIRTVKAMAGVKVVKRWESGKYKAASLVSTAEMAGPERSTTMNAALQSPLSKVREHGAQGEERPRKEGGGAIDLVVIGVSTGGPPVLQTLLQGLTPQFAAPVLVVQHMSPGFLEGLREWLQESTGLKVHIAAQDDELLPGQVYLAPDDVHMGISRSHRILLSTALPENGLRPAVSFLFRSVAEVSPRTSAAILLTGMGRDGAVELKMLHDKGALTFAQDQASSLIHGMPGEAIRLGAASFILSPDKIAEHLRNLQ
jgi:two-component system chemotaxis response regulator CheB